MNHGKRNQVYGKAEILSITNTYLSFNKTSEVEELWCKSNNELIVFQDMT